MKCFFTPNEQDADVLIIPFWEGVVCASDLGHWKSFVRLALESGDFKGKSAEVLFLYPEGSKVKRLLLLGLGKKNLATVDGLRRAYAAALRSSQGVHAKNLSLYFFDGGHLSQEEVIQGIWEGLLLSNYVFNILKGDTLKDALSLIERVYFIGLDETQGSYLNTLQVIAEGVYFARDLVNGSADVIIPAKLAEMAKGLEKQSSHIRTTVHDKAWLEKQKMGLILAVNRASSVDPFLIEMSYQGNPSSKEHIVLVGKGVTYDTGGLALKPVDGMLSMKCDMAGAAAVIGVMRTAALLNLKVNVTGLIPTVENCIGPLSYKHGDVYTSYSGKTVEVNNTDAEGRLILADAIAYAVKHLEATSIIDLATLTGNVVLALGEHIAGFCANRDVLADRLMDASRKTSELLWRLPLHAEYKDAFKSDIADLVNSGGRDAGSIKGALFLEEFVGNVPWAHIDIAGTAYWSKPKYYNPTKATGYGVRLLVEFLRKCQSHTANH